MSNLKLGVEVVSAHNLLPKDGQGSSNAYVELEFDRQKFRTTIKQKDLNPHWNETFYFSISDPKDLSNLMLDAYVYSNTAATNSKFFLGKVKISGTSFVPFSDSVVMYYPLEKRVFFSHVRGELGLKVFITDDRYVRSSNPLPSMDYVDGTTNSYQSQTKEHPLENPDIVPKLASKSKKESSHKLHHLPNKNYPPQEQQYPFSGLMNQQPTSYRGGELRPEALAPKVIHTYSGSSSQPFEFRLKETSPTLGGGQIVGGRVIRSADIRASTYDLVEQMKYLFVRVVKARDLPSKGVTGSLDPFVEVRVGNFKGITKHLEKNQDPEWNTVFAFSEDRMQSSVLEVVVKHKNMIKDEFVGIIRFDLHEVPKRVAPDSPLAPEWYRLENKKGEKKEGELMVAVWMGTQADEAFPDAWHSDAVSPEYSSDTSTYIRSKVYHSPRLWYVRVNVIEVQDLVLSEKTRFPYVYVKGQIGSQVARTKPVQSRIMNALWNEDLMFVAAEPFDEYLTLTIEDRHGPNKEETLGKTIISLNSIQRRADDRMVHSHWYNLHEPSHNEMDETKKNKDTFASRIHLRLCLEGGYHVLDESTQYSSDFRPSAKQLWKSSIGVLELGILNVDGISPMKTRDVRGTSDTYCVAKYGHKWVRTRTIIDSLNPKYNEQYTWEVYDPATVITVGVFDNSHIGENGNGDMIIGKVRIRISTLESGRVYTHAYPLLTLHPSGVKKMGELHLAIRFSCTSMANMMYIYSRPLLPKMHYLRPLPMMQNDVLRQHAVTIVSARLTRAEPPLRKEVVEYMTDAHSHLFSMRRSKANFYRILSVLSGLLAIRKWFGDVCMWKTPVLTGLVHFLFVLLVCFPEIILPTGFLYMFVIGLWNFRFRPKYPPHMNTRISCADSINPDELDEEFDTFPVSRVSMDVIRRRYDRLRIVAGKIQTVLGDVATQGERIQALLSWRDPRATTIFLVFCLVAALVLYATPFQVVSLVAGFYAMRHPRFRHKLPPAPINFFRRLPAWTDSML